jgi:hypothetical protein
MNKEKIKKLTLEILIDSGMSVSFSWHIKRMHDKSNTGSYENRLLWKANHGDRIEFECEWEGFADFPSALTDLLNNDDIIKYYNDILLKIK